MLLVSGGHPRVMWQSLGTLACVTVLVTAFVLAVAADAPRPSSATGLTDLEGVLPPRGETDPGVRSLPLLDPDGPVVDTFPDGNGLDDPALVGGVLRELAARLDLGPVLDELLTTPLGDPAQELDLDLYVGYPYEYPAIDGIVDTWLSAQRIEDDPEAVLDLAGLLLLDAVRSQRDSYEDAPNSWAGVAYSLLRRARDVAPSCEVQLSLTFVVAMGFAPHIGDVEGEVARAIEACPDDPTPLWLLGRLQTVQASLIETFFVFERGPRAMRRAAEETFGELRRAYPDSPLGWAGAGDLYLRLADETERLGSAPFQVRAWRRAALESYAAARHLSDDPALLAGWGHALSATGRHDEAVEALTLLQELMPGEPAYEMLLVDALREAGRPEDVVAFVGDTWATEVPLMSSLSVMPQTRGTEEPASSAYGAAGARGGSVFDQSQKYDAGSSVRDLGFVPPSNGAWSEPWCRAGAYLAALVQADQADRAWALVRDGLDPRSWDGVADCRGRPLDLYLPDELTGLRDDSDTSVGRLGLVAATETGDPADLEAAFAELTDEYTPERELLSQAQDARSDFWRAAGQWGRAEDVVEEWRDQLPEDPWAAHRAGELDFLAGDFAEAVRSYERADELFGTALTTETDWGDHAFGRAYAEPDQSAVGNLLELGAAQELVGDTRAARATYLDALGRTDGFDAWEYGSELLFNLRSQLGSLALAEGDLESAVELLSDVLAEEYGDDGPPGPGDEVGLGRGASHSIGAQDNNLALALAKLGRHDGALVYADSAMAHDPANPVYLDTKAFVLHVAGDGSAAARAYREALEADPTSYVSANNLAVLLAQEGDRGEAADLLADALRAAPGYAIGWHNLGVVQGTESAQLLPSQGALAAAGRLDRDLRGRDDLIVDTEIYESGLDVSKPLPPDWTYAASASSARDRLTLSVLLLLLLRVAWALGLDVVAAKVGERVMRRPHRAVGSAPRTFWRRWPAWTAVVAGCLAIGLPLARAGHSVAERGVLAAAGVAMVLLPLFARGLARARTTVPVVHYAWAPAIAVGAAAMPFGLVFAPYPVLDATRPGLPPAAMDRHPSVVRLRLLVPVVLAVVAAAFLALAALDPTSLARTLALSAVALLGSVLAPVPPLDGSHLRSRLLNLLITLALGLATMAFTLKWV